MIHNSIPFVFFGTPRFATAVLDELAEAAPLWRGLPALVVTLPDRPSGRGMQITSPPVKVWAQARRIPVIQPETLDDALLNTLRAENYSLFIVAAYGKILPKELLAIPKYGTLNVHPSLLPKLRGASPVRSAIISDDRATGVSIMLLDEQMDHGAVVAQASIEIEKKDWPPQAPVLEELLARQGGQLLAEVIPEWVAGKITPEPQNDSEATYCKKIKKEDALLDLSADPYQNFLKIRAYEGWPGAYFFAKRDHREIRVKITDAQFASGKLEILKVIPEGKREMSYADFTTSRGTK